MSREFKVGILVIGAVVAAIGFIAVLKGVGIGPRSSYRLRVGYNFAGGLTVGSPVRVSGVKVGKVRGIRFYGEDPSIPYHVIVTIDIDDKARPSVRQNSKFLINMAGIIGERYLEITPGSKDAEPWKPNELVPGVDPPRLDQLISQGYAVMGEVLDIVEKNRPRIERMIAAIDSFLQNFDEEQMKDVGQLIGNLSSLVKMLNQNVPDMVKDLRPVLRAAPGMINDLRPVLKDAGPLVRNVNAVMMDLKPILTDARPMLTSLQKMLQDLQKYSKANDTSLSTLIKQIIRIVQNMDGLVAGGNTVLNNLSFADEQWIRYFLQEEGLKVYASLGSPNARYQVPPPPPPNVKRPTPPPPQPTPETADIDPDQRLRR
ncbi:MAG: MCE family protein [Deltaproteobacteria bacterium]|nr:MCE family protein [Deltaproteobacteria bacterium]